MGRNTTHAAVFQDVAAGAIQGDGTVRKVRGAVVARTGTGVYTVTINPVNADLLPDPSGQGNLTGGVPQAECACEVEAVGGTALTCQVTHTSNTVKTISITDESDAATDSDFEFAIRRLLG